MSDGALARMTETLETGKRLREYASTHKLGGYDPYPFQKHYHATLCGKITGPYAAEPLEGPAADQLLLSAGNQTGKSRCGGADTAIHAAGEYPSWWSSWWPDMTEQLRKFPDIWCGGSNNDRVRDLAQATLVGPPADPSAWGTGWIPKEDIVDTQRKPGVPNALESVLVRHKKGFNVLISFKAYETNILDWAGTPVPFIWLDEEPPGRIYGQCVARGAACQGKIKMTFTPEQGQTVVVQEFWSNLKAHQGFMLAGQEDSYHPDGRTHWEPDHLERLNASYLPHEREMRIKGIPVLGAGMVFPIPDDHIICDPFPIPPHFARLAGMDFGSGGLNHPTACAWWAFDRDAHTAYLYDCYKGFATEAAVHAAAIKRRGDWIPIAWPHDGNRREAYASGGIAVLYRDLGLNLLREHFTNPDSGMGSPTPPLAVEPGILAMYQAMQEGRIKVFPGCTEWLQEKRMYHRDPKDSSIVDRNDDVMSASRISYVSLPRYAKTENSILRGDLRESVVPNTYDPLEGM